jgi:hypothetical protein
LADVANDDFGTSLTPADISPLSLAILTTKLNGQYLIPSANPSFSPTINFPENVFLTQPAYFISDQAVSNLDFLVSSKDTLSLKYYYQHDPTTAPFGFSSVKGFPQHLDAGSQVASVTNTQSITPNFSIAEVFGFVREKIYSTIGQPFTPQARPAKYWRRLQCRFEHRIDSSFARSVHWNFPEPLDAFTGRQLGSWQTHGHVWREFLLHSTQCAGRTHQ